VIYSCPFCSIQTPTLSDEERERLMGIRALGEALGDDVDALAAELKDFDLL
jgi:hypothetical protein